MQHVHFSNSMHGRAWKRAGAMLIYGNAVHGIPARMMLGPG